MDVAAALLEHFHNTRPLLVRTRGGLEAVGRIIFLDGQMIEVHPCPRHPRSSAIPRWKIQVADIAALEPAPRGYRDDGSGRTVEEMRALVGPQVARFIRKVPA